MNEYFEIRIKGNNYYWQIAELLESNEETEKFLFTRNEDEIILNKNKFSKRELSVDKTHLERLGFYNNEKKRFVSKNGLYVEPIYFHKKESSTIATEEFLGYVIYKSSQTESLRKLHSQLYQDFFNDVIKDKESARTQLSCFYSINHLFQVLKEKYNFPFSALEIITGGK